MGTKQHIIAETEAFVFELFKRKLPENLVYHTFSHSESVAATAKKLAKEMQLSDDSIEIATVAAWLHDVGYTEIYKGHEEVSVRIAADFLLTRSYPEDRIEMVVGCIRATKIPQTPYNILEEIVADADLAGLGKKSFFEQNELIRIEWERSQDRYYTDEQWVALNIDLLTHHRFFTRAAQEWFEEQQSVNLRKQYKKQQRSIIESLPEPVATNASPIITVNASTSSLTQLLSTRLKRLQQVCSSLDQRAQSLMIISIVVLLLTFLSTRNRFMPFVEQLPFILLSIGFVIAMVFAWLAIRLYVLPVHSIPEHNDAADDVLIEDSIAFEVLQLQQTVNKKQHYLQIAYLILICVASISLITYLLGRMGLI